MRGVTVKVPDKSPEVLPAIVSHNQQPYQARGFTAGLRRAVILALHTGPTAEADLAKALAWPLRRTRQVCMSMLKFKIIFLNEHGRFQLAEDGKRHGIWHIPICSPTGQGDRRSG